MRVARSAVIATVPSHEDNTRHVHLFDGDVDGDIPRRGARGGDRSRSTSCAPISRSIRRWPGAGDRSRARAGTRVLRAGTSFAWNATTCRAHCAASCSS